MYLNGNQVKSCDSDTGCRGLNIVAMNGKDHKVIHNKAYDTYADPNQSKNLINDLKDLPEGTIFMVSVKDEASNRLGEPVKEFFSKMGSSEINALGFREAWAFIGVKGQEAFTEKRGATASTAASLGYAQEVRHYKKQTKVTGGSKIEVQSAGYTTGNLARVLINDKEIYSNKDARRGLNIVALDFETHKVVFKKAYDTFADGNASSNFVKDFKSELPQFCIVVAGVKDEASRKLSKEAKEVLAELGAA